MYYICIKFGNCSSDVKHSLFRTFCTSFVSADILKNKIVSINGSTIVDFTIIELCAIRDHLDFQNILNDTGIRLLIAMHQLICEYCSLLHVLYFNICSYTTQIIVLSFSMNK